MKKIKIGIIIVVILIIIVAALYFSLNKKNNSIEQNNSQIEETYSKTMQSLEDRQQFYTIKNIVLNYIDSIKIQDSSNLMKVLYPDYIDEFNITLENIIEKNGLIKINEETENAYVSDEVTKIYYSRLSNNINAYIVNGNLIDNTSTSKIEFEIVLYLDNNNSTYYIVPSEYVEKHNMSKNNIDKFDSTIKEIKNNNVNTFKVAEVTDSTVIIDYLNNFKEMLIYDLDKSYNLINEEYRNLRFGNVDTYKQYIKDNMQYFQMLRVSKYQKIEDKDSVRYILLDQNDKYFIIKEKSIMDYNIYLDTYTIDTPEFTKKYNSLKDEEKITMNIKKFFDSINNANYRYAYSILDESFKENNFDTEEKFEKYVKENLFEYNFVEYKNYTKQGGSTIYNVVVTNSDNDEDEIISKNITIIMQLKEGTDFVMSFSQE